MTLYMIFSKIAGDTFRRQGRLAQWILWWRWERSTTLKALRYAAMETKRSAFRSVGASFTSGRASLRLADQRIGLGYRVRVSTRVRPKL